MQHLACKGNSRRLSTRPEKLKLVKAGSERLGSVREAVRYTRTQLAAHELQTRTLHPGHVACTPAGTGLVRVVIRGLAF